MSASQPPKWAIRFLRWFCKDEYLSEIEGDLNELYHLRTKKSIQSANLFFVWNVFRSFRPINLKSSEAFKSTGMLRNYFTIGVRSLIKDRKFSFINLAGLSLGLSIFLAIVLLVQHELTFDKFHTKADRIYQVIQVFKNADGEDPEIYTSTKLSKALRDDLPMVESAVTINQAASTWTEANGKRFFEEDGIMSGPQFFEIFDFELVAGKPSEVLKNNRSVVLSESLVNKYFGLDDPIGKEVNFSSYGRFTITGILKDVPANSYIQFNYIITQDLDVYFSQTAPWFREFFQSWFGHPAATYVLLDDSSSKGEFELQISRLLSKYQGEGREINKHYLLGMLDLHFNSHEIDGTVNTYLKGDYRKVQILIGIAIIILSMACLNYINISTARYIRRTREVGVRKAMGAYNFQVTYQFLIESFLMVLVSFSVGVFLVYYMIPYFNMLTGIQLVFDWAALINVLPYFAITVILVTFLAGFYPAFHLSRFPAINVLKNLTVSTKGNGSLRKALVTIQYVFVIVIITALIIVNQQYLYMSNKPLGFNTGEMVILEINSGDVRNNFESLKNDLLRVPDVKSVTGLTRMIGGYRAGVSVNTNALDSPEEKLPMRFYGMDVDGISTLGLELVYGNNFTGVQSLDSTSILLNEAAAEKYGGNSIVGKYLLAEESGDNNLRAKVIGIVNNFHYQSLHNEIGPVVIGHYNNPFVSLDDIVIQLSGFNTLRALESIEQIHGKYDTRDMLTWEFMDDMAQRAYAQEQIFRNIFIGASLLSFCIALLGMIGLTSYSVTAKTKEIGIRKILGASFLGILNMEVKELAKFLTLSAVISIPLSWWLANSWLTNFEYRITISPLSFMAVILLMLVVSFLVVFLVGRKIAASPPVEAIRCE